ncbi:MAG TPA: hypothetical protein ENI11_05865 [Actinobacteria bacterium]|nr:hypothetical protein [Actinomycetota bacterium]
MFDMRYHIASLVAVFLALTIGLLLGSLLVDKGILADQQEKIMKSITADVDKINERNADLQLRLKELEHFQSQVLPIAVKDRLTDKQVVVVTFTDEQVDLARSIEKMIASSGATAFPLSIQVDKLDFSDKNLVARLGSVFDETGAQGGDFERRFWNRFAKEVVGREPAALTGALIDQNLISFDTSSIPAGNIVIVAATKKQARNRDLLFLESFRQADATRIVGVEDRATRPSRVGAYKLRNISTVDNIDEVAGKISLAYLLLNPDVTAHFGAKSTADRLLP